jgi:hypothetical protein
MEEETWTFGAIAFPVIFAIGFLVLLCAGHIQLSCHFKVEDDLVEMEAVLEDEMYV